jgi:hypothetical protein
MPNFYEELAAELDSARHIPDQPTKANIVALVQARALVDIAESLRVIVRQGDASLYVVADDEPSTEQPAEVEVNWQPRIGDRVAYAGGTWFVDDVKISEGDLAALLVAEEDDVKEPGWTFTRYIAYVDHPTDGAYSIGDGDLQGTEPAGEGVVSAVAVFTADDEGDEGDLDDDFSLPVETTTAAIEKLRAKSKKKSK